MNAGLGLRIALDTNSLARALAGAGVGGGALAADRQTAQVTNAAITLDALEALQVHADLAAQIAFDHVSAVLDRMDDLGYLLFAKIFGADLAIDFGALENIQRVGRANAINVAERDIDALLTRNFNTYNTCHSFSSMSSKLR